VDEKERDGGCVVLAMSPGNLAAVQVWTAKTGGFGWTRRVQSLVLCFGFHIYGRIQICYF